MNVSLHVFVKGSNTINVREGGILLRTFSILKGLPVLTRSGHKLGTVEDLSISEANEVTGIIVKGNKLFKKTIYIPLDSIVSFGSDEIIVNHSEDYKATPKANLLLTKDELIGKLLITEMGEELGLLQDVCFMEKMGKIIAYETTDGLFSKNKFVHTTNPPKYGEDAIIVSVYKQ